MVITNSRIIPSSTTEDPEGAVPGGAGARRAARGNSGGGQHDVSAGHASRAAP